MLTPQDISEKGFIKAVFGGYDMASVDEFLETVSSDYGTLYKENAILKGKLKVLVEKVEEYRSTEDAMRMALLTAQRMGEEITLEANRSKEEILRNADAEVKSKLASIQAKITAEQARLAAASKETTKFLELSQAIVRKHAEFLKKLESANHALKPARAPERTASPAKREPLPPPAPVSAPPTMPTPAPAPIPVVEAPPRAVEIDSIAQEIGNAVEKIASGNLEAEEAQVEAAKSVAAPPAPLVESAGDTITLPNVEEEESEEDAEDITPRPKFDFDDLKFGANFDSDD